MIGSGKIGTYASATASMNYNVVTVTAGDGLNGVDVSLKATASANVVDNAVDAGTYQSHNTVDITGGTGIDAVTVLFSANVAASAATIGAATMSADAYLSVGSNTVTVDVGDGANTVDIDFVVGAAAFSLGSSAEAAVSMSESNDVDITGGERRRSDLRRFQRFGRRHGHLWRCRILLRQQRHLYRGR